MQDYRTWFCTSVTVTRPPQKTARFARVEQNPFDSNWVRVTNIRRSGRKELHRDTAPTILTYPAVRAYICNWTVIYGTRHFWLLTPDFSVHLHDSPTHDGELAASRIETSCREYTASQRKQIICTPFIPIFTIFSTSRAAAMFTTKLPLKFHTRPWTARR